jgi:alkanesulfonate monooxygenase SsuD/methylene tetrahydromethanopterin reductase-like flavin-dependent oxidoreductase (luciferase family)
MAAKQIALLQHVSGDRVVLGVGTGGAMHGTEAWEAVGVPYAERGRRTDKALALLPGLIRGETVELPSGASITLSPGAEVPPILIGGNSPAALRRAVRHGAGWFPGMATSRQIVDGARQLPHGAQIAVGGMALLGADATDPRIDRLVASLVDGLGIPPEEAARLPITGTPAQAAERFAAYADAGATWLVVGTIGDDWQRPVEADRPSRYAARLRASSTLCAVPVRGRRRDPRPRAGCSAARPPRARFVRARRREYPGRAKVRRSAVGAWDRP